MDPTKESSAPPSGRILPIITLLKKQYSDAKTILTFSNTWELFVAVVLSAQCTDKMVNKVTEKLFKKYKTIKDYANASLEELEQDIRSTGFYRNKAKSIKAAAVVVLEKFHGEIPKTIAEVITIPGAARKTANVVLGNAYDIFEGIAVDTHVRRVAFRLGLTKNTNPDKIEQDLMHVVPKNNWFSLTYLLIEHGRKICEAKKPKCDQCILNKICPSAFQFPEFQKAV